MVGESRRLAIHSSARNEGGLVRKAFAVCEGAVSAYCIETKFDFLRTGLALDLFCRVLIVLKNEIRA